MSSFFLYLLALNFVFISGKTLLTSFDEDGKFFVANDYTSKNFDNMWMKHNPMPVPSTEARSMCNLEETVPASPSNTLEPPGVSKNWSWHQKRNHFPWTQSEVGCGPSIDITPDTSFIFECDPIDPDYILDKRTGHCYKFHRHGLTWSRAFLTCAAEGGHLAIINSATEADVLREIGDKTPVNDIEAANKNYMWIGMRYWSGLEQWLNIDGRTLQEAGFETWYTNQPDNNLENCGGICRGNEFPGLHNVDCGVSKPFICEKLPGIQITMNNRMWARMNVRTAADEDSSAQITNTFESEKNKPNDMNQ